MIQKNWTTKQIYYFCKNNKYTETYNTEKECSPIYEITKFKNLDNPILEKILSWCRNNCECRWELCRWHLGFENNIFFKFYSKKDALAFYRYYDKVALPKIDVDMRVL